jgi:adenylate kinase family enzyme
MKTNHPINIILLGDPASGKATQAARLVKKYHLYDFDMGKAVSTPWAKSIYDYKSTTGAGNLAPTWVARRILKNVIAEVPRNRGILFDGHPKMIGEAKLVASLLKKNNRTNPLFIYLSIPSKETAKRANMRRRSDDSEKALRNRARYYRKQISQVVTFLKHKYKYKNISGLGSRDQVSKKIKTCVEKFVRTNKK